MADTPETVVLIHGLYMHGLELELLRRRVARAGYAARLFNYPSLLLPVDENARRLTAYLRGIVAERLHLVGHSLGGLVILRMFEQGAELPLGRVIFLGSPVRGSRSAQTLVRRRLGWLLGRSGERGLTEEREPRWIWPRELGLITGTHELNLNPFHGRLPSPHDGLVAEEETYIEGAKDRVQIYANHTGMLFNRELAEQVNMFLRTGAFRH
jgi:pimeloyl-ACP methyl ester carboxylesterase